MTTKTNIGRLLTALFFFTYLCSAQSLLFKSGFEANTVLSPIPSGAIGNTSAIQNFSGADASTGYSWPMSIYGWNPGTMSYDGLHVEPPTGATDLDSLHWFNQIITTTGHTGASTKALHLEWSGYTQSCCQQVVYQSSGMQPPLKKVYYRFWMRYPTYLGTWLAGSPSTYIGQTIISYKSSSDYRIHLNSENLNDPSHLHPKMTVDALGQTGTENYIDPITGAIYQSTNATNPREFAHVSNSGINVPAGAWFLVEISFNRSIGNDGYYDAAINGQTVGHTFGPDYGALNQEIQDMYWNSLYWFQPPPTPSGGTGAQEDIDDLEIWDAPPCGTFPCGSGSTTTWTGAIAPSITSPYGAVGTVGVPFQYQITANGSPTSYSTESALPSGLSLNSSTGLISGTPTAAGTYQGIYPHATNSMGYGTQWIEIQINNPATSPPTISSFTATPTTISAGAWSRLTWAQSGATTLTLNPGSVNVTGKDPFPVNPTVTTTYTLTASNSVGPRVATTTVTVSGGTSSGVPTISSFTANPSTITAGGTSSLAWSVSGATSISINQGVGVVTGSAVNVSPAGTTIYTLTATNSVGPSSAQTTVTVNAPVSLRTTGPENGLQFGRPSTAQLAAGLGVCKFGDYVAGLGSAFDGNCLNPPLMKSLDFLWPTWTIAGTAAPNSGQFLPESVVSPYWVYMGGGQIATNPGSNLYFGTNVASVGLQAALFDPTTGWFAASYLPNHGPNHLNGVPVDAAHPTTVTLDGFSSDYSFYVTSSGQHLPWDAPYPQTRAAWYDGWNAFFKYAVDHLPTIRLAPHIGSMEDSSLSTFQHIHQYTPIMEREPFCLSSLYTASNSCGGLSNINQIYAQINNLYWFGNVAPKLFTNDPATRIVLLGTWLDNNDIHSALAYYSMMRGPNTNFDLLERTSAGQPPVDPSTWVPFANKMGAGISSPSSIIGSGASSVLRRSFQGAIAYFNLAAGTQVVSLPSGSFDWSGNLISSLTLTNGKGDVVFNTNTGVLGGPTILSFSASPTNVSSGGASTLTWSVTGATSLSIAGIGPVTGTSIVVNPTTTTTYNLTASNANGSITASTTVTVGGSGTCIGNHSYWRVYGTKASNGPTDTTNGLSSSELQFRSVSGGSNLATGGTALASSTISGFPASNAFDGNNSTFWSSALFAPVPQWLGYHFASPVNIVEFVWRDRGDGSTTWQDPTAGTLDYSDDGSTWTSAGAFSTSYLSWLGTGSSNTFTVGSPCGSLPSITNFIATPSTISSGSSTLSWTTIGATSLSISPTVGTVTGLTSTSVSPSITTTYTLTAVNGNGSVTQTATVTVSSSGGLPSITSFTATPSTTTGGSSTLAWVTSGATSLSISPTVGIVTGLTSTSVSPTVTTTYTLTATNSAGSVTQTATVTVNVPPPPNIVSFIATPSVISTGNSSTLSWVVTGATSLSINQSIGTVTGTTSRVVSPTATTTYTLTASNANGTVTKDVTVFIGAPGSVGFVVNGATIRGATIPAH